MGSALLAALSTMLYAIAPSCTRSSTPVTVTVCGTFQLAAVNVRPAAETAPSAALLDATGITTSAVGWLFNTTVKLAAPPASVVARPAVGVTVMAAASLSALVTATSGGLTPVYAGSLLLAA